MKTGEIHKTLQEPIKPVIIDHETQTIDEEEDEEAYEQPPKATVIQPSSEITITIAHLSPHGQTRQGIPHQRNRRLSYALPKKKNKFFLVLLTLVIGVIGIFAYLYISDIITEIKLTGSWKRTDDYAYMIFKYNPDNTFEAQIVNFGFTTGTMSGTWKVSGDVITERVTNGSGVLIDASSTQQRRIIELTSNKFEGFLIDNGSKFIWYKQ